MGTVSKSQRAASDRWDRENMASVMTKIRKTEADEFKAACERQGMTRSAVLHECIRDYIQKYGDGK